MKPALILSIIFLLSLFLSRNSTHAQDIAVNMPQNSSYKNQLSIGDGIVTPDEILGWIEPPILRGRISEPNKFSGAIFLSYHYFFIPGVAIGLSAGLDNEQGSLSYGYGGPNAISNLNGENSGYYSMHSYTTALDLLYVYEKAYHNPGMFYGSTSLGVTYFDDKCTTFSNAPYGSPVPLPSNPYDYRFTHFNFNLTPIGYSFGNRIAGFIELNFGYKGLVRGGLSVKF